MQFSKPRTLRTGIMGWETELKRMFGRNHLYQKKKRAIFIENAVILIWIEFLFAWTLHWIVILQYHVCQLRSFSLLRRSWLQEIHKSRNLEICHSYPWMEMRWLHYTSLVQILTNGNATGAISTSSIRYWDKATDMSETG